MTVNMAFIYITFAMNQWYWYQFKLPCPCSRVTQGPALSAVKKKNCWCA